MPLPCCYRFFLILAITITSACSTGTAGHNKTVEALAGEQSDKDLQTKSMLAKINTDIDPDFVYQYYQSKYVPPEGKVLLIMGQDLTTITEYMNSFSDRPKPGGWTAYWGITSMNGVDRMNAEDIATQYGYQNHQTLVEDFPEGVLQSGLWMVGMWDILKKARKGEYDTVIRQFSVWAKTINRPLYLRIGYEFDGMHNQMEPSDYVRVYRRIVDIMREEHADNIAFVWQSYAAPTYKTYALSDWYPGDDYVDWVGISLFAQLYSPVLNKEADDVFNFAKQHKKPVMVAEASPVNGIDKNSTEAWDTWFVKLLSLAYQKNIKAISYINADWTSYSGFTSNNWKDARLQNNQQITDAWFKETGKLRYLKQSPGLFQQLGYSR